MSGTVGTSSSMNPLVVERSKTQEVEDNKLSRGSTQSSFTQVPVSRWRTFHQSTASQSSALDYTTNHQSTPDSEESLYLQGRKKRRQAFFRAVYSEFVGTIIFFVPQFACLAHSYQEQWGTAFSNLAIALTTGVNAIAIILCFSELSGSQFNPAITFALWLTKKQSTRKFIAFTFVQFLAPLVALLIIKLTFSNDHPDMYSAIAIQPYEGALRGKVFATEFVCTFILTYVAFALALEEAQVNITPSSMRIPEVTNTKNFSSTNGGINHEATLEGEQHETSSQQDSSENKIILYAATPQSKLGFAPFAIGYVLIALVFYGGSSRVGMNPTRFVGPAIFANRWKDWDMYILGEYLGASLAAILVTYGPQSGKRNIGDFGQSIRAFPREFQRTVGNFRQWN